MSHHYGPGLGRTEPRCCPCWGLRGNGASSASWARAVRSPREGWPLPGRRRRGPGHLPKVSRPGTRSRQFRPVHGNSHCIKTDRCEMSLTKSVSSRIKQQKNPLEVRARKASSEVRGHGSHVKILRLCSHSDGLKQIPGVAERLNCDSLKSADSFFPEQRLESRTES